MNPPRGRTALFRLLVPLVTLLLALALAEPLFRWYAWWTFDRTFPPWTENLVGVSGAQVFEFKPNAFGVFPGNADSARMFSYRTNAHGLRDRNRPAKAAGTKRVLVMGDSYTWGYAVAEDEAFPQAAERLLRARGRTDIEVVNGGIPDYNSRQERVLLERLLPIYRPDAVFLAYVVNDAEPSTAMPTTPDETYRHSTSWFLTELAEVINRRVFRRRALPSAKVTPGASYLDGFAPDSIKWRDSRQAIAEMRDLAAATGVPFGVLVMPDFTQEFDERYPWRPVHQAVVSWGRELGIPTDDLLDNFRGENHQLYWVPWDGHPNAMGHERIAEVLVAKILGVLPAAESSVQR